MGKGSSPRPFEVPQEEFLSNWERTFGQKENQVKEEESKTDQDPTKENAK